MSNIQSLSHIDQSKIAHAIKFIKNEIKFGTNVNVDVMEEKNNINIFCKNELTGQTYSFLKGSPEERNLFRVMPIDGTEKLYFDSKDEYNTWFRKNHKRRSMYSIKPINYLNKPF